MKVYCLFPDNIHTFLIYIFILECGDRMMIIINKGSVLILSDLTILFEIVFE
jgi:hypothetical protein